MRAGESKRERERETPNHTHGVIPSEGSGAGTIRSNFNTRDLKSREHFLFFDHNSAP